MSENEKTLRDLFGILRERGGPFVGTVEAEETTTIGKPERKCHVLRCTVVRQECDDWQRYEMECGGEFMWQVQDAPSYCPYCGGRIAE